MIRLLVADDHKLLIDGIKTALKNIHDISVVAEATNGQEVLKELELNQFDVILMDISMPIMDGLECTKIVMSKYPKTKIIALTQFNETRFIKRMIQYGAKGYLLKDAHRDEIVEAIRTVIAGKEYFARNLNIAPNLLNPSKSDTNTLTIKLSPRETEVLNYICNGLSSSEIAEKLDLSFGTIEKFRSNLINKSGTRNSAGLVRWAVENHIVR